MRKLIAFEQMSLDGFFVSTINERSAWADEIWDPGKP